MAQIVVTVISVQQREQRNHQFPTPTLKTIGIGDSYILSPRGTGSTILDNTTGTEYTLEESESEVASLIAADQDVNVTNNKFDVFVQDQTTPTLIADFTRKQVDTTTAAPLSIDDHDITVTDTTGFAVGQHITVISVGDIRYYFAHITAIVSNTITVDTPLDFAFPSGSPVTGSDDNLAVDGSTTPIIFGVRGVEGTNQVPIEVDITRLIFTCITTSAVDLSKFANITSLTNGLVLRHRDGVYSNVFNVHSNGDIANIAYDWTPYAATNPSQGVDGFVARLTWAGQSKMGVTIRLAAGEDLELIVQDDLTGITSFKVIAEGSVVDPN